ncbi:OmpH family outer membrane protein [bacterium]|nr:OmpH family outer membrane protein [bacterium]
MKFSTIALSVSSLFLASALQAQKLGHVNMDELLQLYPETTVAQDSLRKYAARLEADFSEMRAEYENKVQLFQQNEPNMTNLNKESKMRELQEMQVRIQEFEVKANQDLQQKQAELLKPIVEKVQDAVKAVSNEGKFTYIFDSSPSKGMLIATEGGVDVMPLVKKKLGI